MIPSLHRAECADPDCARVWRENCTDCLAEVTAAHTAATGHLVTTRITTPAALGDLPRLARRVGLRPLVYRRGS